MIAAILSPKGNAAWIGLTDFDTEGTFVFLDGVKSTKNNTGWSSNGNQPNGGNSENCVVINHKNHNYNKANDLPCNKMAYALCEKRVN